MRLICMEHANDETEKECLEEVLEKFGKSDMNA